MVKINSSRGRCASKLVHYVLDPEKQLDPDFNVEDVISTNMFGRSALELAQEFTFFSDLNPRVERIMTHYSVSLPPGEFLDSGLMDGLASELLSQMEHDGLFLVVRHHDQEHHLGVHHFHIAASSMNFDGSWVSDSFDRLSLKSIERHLERSFGLSSPESGTKPYLTTGEFRRKRRTDELLPKERLWDAIRNCAADRPSFPLLVTRLIAEDVQVRFRSDDSGEISGISFSITRGDSDAAGDAHFRGGQLGKPFSFYGLQQHLGVFFADHQIPELLRLQDTSGVECRELLVRRDQLSDRYEFWCELAGSDDDLVLAGLILASDQAEDFPCLLFSPAALALQRSSGKDAQFAYLQELLSINENQLDVEISGSSGLKQERRDGGR
jgi:Relaxase/Mobilisation nuclease domain